MAVISKVQRHSVSLLTICAIFFATVFSFMLYVYLHTQRKKDELIAPQTFTLTNIKNTIHDIITPEKDELKETIDVALRGAQGSYGVMVTDLSTATSYGFNEHTSYTAGSLYKLWVMATAYQQIQAGKLNPNEVLSKDVKDINDDFGIASDEAELTEGTQTFTVRQALQQMITISHNYAALLLIERVGSNNINAFIKQNGFTESNFNTVPTTTAYDIDQFYEKLYKGEFANEQYTNEMIDLLKDQQRNNKLPKYLPDGTVIGHKTGEIDMYTHDAGIVFLPHLNYVITILSKSGYPPGAEDRIAQVSQAVYNYFKDKD